MPKPWRKCTGCGLQGWSFGPGDCPRPRDECKGYRKIRTHRPVTRAKARALWNRKGLTVPEDVLRLSEDQIEAAARYACRSEGWNPDQISVKRRPMWHIYAELLRAQFLPAINHALAGVSPEGKSSCPAESPPSGSCSSSPTSSS